MHTFDSDQREVLGYNKLLSQQEESCCRGMTLGGFVNVLYGFAQITIPIW